ncbi:hypothetical protein JCM33374_g2794 [Metschnikowia sp. JCM 33374]|nr:hypothetical protein JCM33374_g2794 [Metschnikowia sp. JCM 33374]
MESVSKNSKNGSGNSHNSHSSADSHTVEAQSHSHSHETEASTHDHDHSHAATSLFHSHSHSHQPNELLGKGFLTNPAVRITWIGLAVNIIMAGTKAVGGVYFHSQALIADAIHSVSDMIADFLTLATVNVASKEGSYTKFPLGYGKIESVGTFAVAGVLLFAGVTVGWSSLLQIAEIFLPSQIYEHLSVLQVHSHSHSLGPEVPSAHLHSHESVGSVEKAVPNINAAWLALGSIGIKEILYRKTMSIANQTNSKVLIANAWHHRVDSLTAGVAFITVTSGVLLGWSWLDAVGGLLVSVLIIKAGWGSFRDAWYELVDRSAEPKSDDYTQIKSIVDIEVQNVSKSMETGFKMTDFSVLTAGARSNLILKLTTDKDITLSSINDLEHELVAGIKEKDKNVGKVFIEYYLNEEKRH